MVTKTITKMEQIAMPTRATNATGDLIWSDELAPLSIDASIRAASPLNKFPSSASCDNCFSAAMRRFPAGEELMQSPVAMEQNIDLDECVKLRESNLKLFMLIHLFLSILIYLLFILHVFPHVPAVLFLNNDICCHHQRGRRKKKTKAWHILNRNKWQCSAENGNEIHVKFITRVAVLFEKWVTKIWWQSDEKRKSAFLVGEETLLVELFQGRSEAES